MYQEYFYIIPPTLSQAPSASKGNNTELQQETESFVEIAVLNFPLTVDRLQFYHSEQDKDELCHSIKAYCKEGWPEKKELDTRLIPYWKV